MAYERSGRAFLVKQLGSSLCIDRFYSRVSLKFYLFCRSIRWRPTYVHRELAAALLNHVGNDAAKSRNT